MSLIKTLTKDNTQSSSESGKNDGINVFKMRGNILREINVDMSITIVNFKNVNIHCVFSIVPRKSMLKCIWWGHRRE